MTEAFQDYRIADPFSLLFVGPGRAFPAMCFAAVSASCRSPCLLDTD